MSLGDSIGEGVIIADNLLLVNDEIAVVVAGHKLALMLEIILKFFV